MRAVGLEFTLWKLIQTGIPVIIGYCVDRMTRYRRITCRWYGKPSRPIKNFLKYIWKLREISMSKISISGDFCAKDYRLSFNIKF